MTLSVDVMATAYSYEILDAIEVTRLHQCSAARCVDAAGYRGASEVSAGMKGGEIVVAAGI
jgi:hypothetical protein